VKNIPKIEEVKLSSWGLEVADFRKNCSCGNVELLLRSNISLKVAELRLRKCFLLLAELRLRTQKKVTRAHLWCYVLTAVRGAKHYWTNRFLAVEHKSFWICWKLTYMTDSVCTIFFGIYSFPSYWLTHFSICLELFWKAVSGSFLEEFFANTGNVSASEKREVALSISKMWQFCIKGSVQRKQRWVKIKYSFSLNAVKKC
jgi:hypothetical protein